MKSSVQRLHWILVRRCLASMWSSILVVFLVLNSQTPQHHSLSPLSVLVWYIIDLTPPVKYADLKFYFLFVLFNVCPVLVSASEGGQTGLTLDQELKVFLFNVTSDIPLARSGKPTVFTCPNLQPHLTVALSQLTCNFKINICNKQPSLKLHNRMLGTHMCS